MRQLASLVLILSITSAHAQQAAPLKQRGSTKLEDLLDTLGKDFEAYIAAVPNFVSAEHITSGIYDENSSTPSSYFEATGYFRVQRTFTPEGRLKFIESHSIKTINGKPAQEDGLKKAPLLASGIFTYAFAVLAPQYRHCFDFSLMVHDPKHAETVFVLFTSNKLAWDDGTCPAILPITNGSIMLDGVIGGSGMHVTHIDFKTPHSHAVPGIDTESRWVVQFGPSSMDTESFWMPSVAILEVVRNGAWDFPYPPIAFPGWETANKSPLGKRWVFVSKYTNYRKMPPTSTTPIPGPTTAPNPQSAP